MSISLVDAGVNLSNHQFDDIHEAVLQRAAEANVTQCFLLAAIYKAAMTLLTSPNNLSNFALQGFTLMMQKPPDEHLEEHLTTLSQTMKWLLLVNVASITIVIFLLVMFSAAFLDANLQLAEQLNMPVYLHERDASEDMLAILSDYKVRGVLHCFTGDEKALQSYLAMGLYIGVTGWVCDERRGEQLQALVPSIPLESLVN